MKRLFVLLPALLLFCCDNAVEVTIDKPFTGWTAYGKEPVLVYCHPSRYVDFVELLVDSAVVGVDTFPPYSITWDVSGLGQGSVHRVRARATSGSSEYLSDELTATVGYRSRVVTNGSGESLQVYLPNGTRVSAFAPMPGSAPKQPRFGSGCSSVVFIADRRLFRWAGQAAVPLDSIENGIYHCDAWGSDVVFEGLPTQVAHLFVRGSSAARVQLTHDGDVAYIDSSPFTCTANSWPAFSPDGEWIAFFRESKCLAPGDPHEGETRRDVFVTNRTGGGLANLTPTREDGTFTGMSWTFDGKWVLFRDLDNAPARVLAANRRGRCVDVVGMGAVTALACSPLDSTLLFTGAGDPAALASVRIRWTDDTLYAAGQPVELGGSFGESVDWVEYEP